MVKLDEIWDRARADLVIVTEGGDEDVFLWEHSARIARTAQLIARLPGIREQTPDEVVLVAAALYHSAGWVTQLEEGRIQRAEILVRSPSDTLWERSARVLEASLAKLLPAKTLRQASGAIRALNNRRIESIEGQIIAEADNLDEFGLLAFWPTIRRGVLDGKGVQAVIDTWRRRREYQFWTARLNESFRFVAVQKLAEARLAAYERLMGALEEIHLGNDIKTALADSDSDEA